MVLNYALRRKRYLWERRYKDDDFLLLRLGSGNLPMSSVIEYPSRRFNLQEDALEQAMYAIAEKNRQIENVPILFDLKQYKTSGLVGSSETVLTFTRQLMIRIALLYSYDEVKIVFIGNKQELMKLGFLRYLPHTWSTQQDFRLIATDKDEALRLGEHLKQVLGKDLSGGNELKDILKKRPYYIIFASDRIIYQSIEILKEIAQVDTNIGVTTL